MTCHKHNRIVFSLIMQSMEKLIELSALTLEKYDDVVNLADVKVSFKYNVCEHPVTVNKILLFIKNVIMVLFFIFSSFFCICLSMHTN